MVDIFAEIRTSDVKNIGVVVIDFHIIIGGEFRIGDFLITWNYIWSIVILLLMNCFPAVVFRISQSFFYFLIDLLSFLVNETTFIFHIYIYYIVTNITNLLIIIILRILIYETHLLFLLAVKFPCHTFLIIIVLLFLFQTTTFLFHHTILHLLLIRILILRVLI